MKPTPYRVSLQDLTTDPRRWANRLYDQKILVLRGLTGLTRDEVWAANQVFGRPWSITSYQQSFERVVPNSGVHVVTEYSNVMANGWIGNSMMPWHRDIPWHRDKRYPIRSLYPIFTEDSDFSVGTKFCDCDVLFQRLSAPEVTQLMDTEVQIQNWYQMNKGDEVETQWIPLVEVHGITKRMSVMLNSFGPKDETLPFSCKETGAWILDARSKSDPQSVFGVSWINYLHSVVVTDEDVYTHQWEDGDLVLFDNASGVFHARPRLQQPSKPRKFIRLNIHHPWQV